MAKRTLQRSLKTLSNSHSVHAGSSLSCLTILPVFFSLHDAVVSSSAGERFTAYFALRLGGRALPDPPHPGWPHFPWVPGNIPPLCLIQHVIVHLYPVYRSADLSTWLFCHVAAVKVRKKYSWSTAVSCLQASLSQLTQPGSSVVAERPFPLAVFLPLPTERISFYRLQCILSLTVTWLIHVSWPSHLSLIVQCIPNSSVYSIPECSIYTWLLHISLKSSYRCIPDCSMYLCLFYVLFTVPVSLNIPCILYCSMHPWLFLVIFFLLFHVYLNVPSIPDCPVSWLFHFSFLWFSHVPLPRLFHNPFPQLFLVRDDDTLKSFLMREYYFRRGVIFPEYSISGTMVPWHSHPALKEFTG
jgi:hypothetical protein